MGECAVACVLKKDASYQRSFKFKRLQALGFLSCLITAMFSPTFSSVFLSYFISVRFIQRLIYIHHFHGNNRTRKFEQLALSMTS